MNVIFSIFDFGWNGTTIPTTYILTIPTMTTTTISYRTQIEDKRKRVYLRKCAPDREIRVEDLFIGATLVVYSRQLTLTGYADENTAIAMANRRESGTIIVKPSDVCRVGRVLAAVQEEGMQVVDFRTVDFGARAKEELTTALPRDSAELLAGTSCAIQVMGKDANAVLERMFSDVDLVRSMDAEHARALAELASTQPSSTKSSARSSLVVVKPSGMEHLGKIVDVIVEKKGFTLVQAKTMVLTRAEAESFYAVYVDVLDKEEVKLMVDELSSGGCVALHLSAPEDRSASIVDELRDVVGPRDPEVAKALRPESLRALFGVDKQRNAAHCTDLADDGSLEVEFFFHLPRKHAPIEVAA